MELALLLGRLPDPRRMEVGNQVLLIRAGRRCGRQGFGCRRKKHHYTQQAGQLKSSTQVMRNQAKPTSDSPINGAG
jgi:hypothetical protein